MSKIERTILELHFKLTGSALGFYNPATKKFAPDMESQGVFQANLEIVRAALKSSWTAKELEDFILERYRAGERHALISDFLPKKSESKKLDPEQNLLLPGESHFHPECYTVAPSTYKVVDGEMVAVSRPLKAPKETYTLKELACYYFKKIGSPRTENRMQAVMGALRWTLGEASLDALLFAIDLASEENRPVAAIEIQNFLPRAEEEVKLRRARVKE